MSKTFEPFVYLLKRPLVVDDKDASGRIVATQRYTQIKVLREPELRHLRVIYASSDRFNRLLAVIDQLTDLPAALAERLNFRDVEGFSEAVRPFFEEEEESPTETASSPAATST